MGSGTAAARQRLDEDLHTTAETQHQVQRRLILDVVVGQSSAVLKLFAREDQALLVRRDALLVLRPLCPAGVGQPLLVHHENRRVGPADHFGQVRMGVPHLIQPQHLCEAGVLWETPFFEFSLCLSRACLGKTIVFYIQMVQKWRF